MFLLRLLVADHNAHVATFFGYHGDYLEFHSSAAQFAHDASIRLVGGSDFFRHYLGFIYFHWGTSYLLAHLFSVFAFVISAWLFLKVWDQVFVHKRGRLLAFAVFGLLPSLLIIGTQPLREQYQIMMLILYFWAALKYLTSPQIWQIPLMLVAAVALAFLHKGLGALMVLVLVITILWPVLFNLRFQLRLRHIQYLVLSIMLIGLGVAVMFEYGAAGTLSVLLDGDITPYIESYRSHASTGARAYYGVQLDSSSSGAIAWSFLSMIVYYLFYPFLWELSWNPKHIYAFAETLLRALFLLGSVVTLMNPDRQLRIKASYLLFCYFLMAAIWASGTVNYGTSIRHNLTHLWMILILGAPPLALIWRKYIFKPLFGTPGAQPKVAMPQVQRVVPSIHQ